MAKIKVDGLDKLEKKLKKNVTMTDISRVVRQNGKNLQERAERRAPVDTGTLKRSIDLEITDSGLTAVVEPTAEYAPYVEYGTRFMNAQPYLKPAFNEQKQQFKSDMQKLVR